MNNLKVTRKIINKKGSHVGVVLSFAIFTISIIYLYSIIEPAIANNKEYQIELDNLILNLKNNISGNLTSTTIYIIPAITENCIEVQNLKNFTGDSSLVVVDSGGNFLDYSFSGTAIEISITNSSEKLFKIYSSNDFNTFSSSLESCQQISLDSYSVGLVSTKEYILKNKISGLVNEYQNNYTGLKTNLRISVEKDFSFNIIYAGGLNSGSGERNNSKTVYASEEKIKYFDTENGINIGDLMVKLW